MSLLMTLIHNAAEWERRALEHPARYAVAVVCLAAAAGLLRWRAIMQADAGETPVLFEQEETPAVTGLGLRRDGAQL